MTPVLRAVHATVAAANAASPAVLTKFGYRHVRDITEPDGVIRVLTCTADVFRGRQVSTPA